MAATFEEAGRVAQHYVAFARVKQLVADFRANEKFYPSQDCQEQEARRDFIDKFRLALGGDVNHETQKNLFDGLPRDGVIHRLLRAAAGLLRSRMDALVYDL
jgi:hypothetical protein